ncbi:MAG TPA: undecaprenyl-diphosphatase UppP [Bacteriovoracaceae bacterium]|nr:undecaprenyl-diphosphatase UppP [Bacteriovoracaceae bacterium]
MNNFEAVIYGVIQGLSEFLPVSSSGHLALLPHLMNIEDPGVKFDLMMHLGTALAVMAFFKAEILKLLSQIKPLIFFEKKNSNDLFFAKNFIISTSASVFCILMLLPFSKMAREPWVIILNLVVFGALLWFADWFNMKNHRKTNPMEEGIQWKLAILIGVAQSLAIFPGVSRSGITITMALLLGLRRRDAGAFSFLLSLPIIFAGILKEIPSLLDGGDSTSLMPLMVGVVTSFIVGFLTIHFFMKVIAKIPLYVFSLYRWLIALAVYFVIY